MSALSSVGYFLFTLFFNILVYALWIRLGLRYMRFSSLHPISQLIQTVTNPLVSPINKLFGQKPPIKIEYGTALVLIAVELIKFFLIGLFFFSQSFPWSVILIFTVADLMVHPLNLLFYMIIIRVIMSWVQPHWQHPLNDVLSSFTNPILRYAQRLIPVIAGFDFSPFFVLIFIKVISIFISSSLPIPLI